MMKTTIRILISFTALLLAACADTDQMMTVINPDGSCYREFTQDVKASFLTGDSISDKNAFPVEVDSASKIRWKYAESEWYTVFPAEKSFIDSVVHLNQSKDTLKKNNELFTAVLRLDYASVKEMGEKFGFKKSHEWSDMKIKYSLEKKFRWFNTYYTYREIYPQLKTNFKIPIEKNMTKEEASFWFTGQPNLIQGMNGIEIREYVGKLEDNYNSWYGLNVWTNEYDELIKNYDLVKNKPVPAERLKELCDTIFMTVKDKEIFNMQEVLKSYFKTNAFDFLWENSESPMKKYEKNSEEEEYIKYFSKAFSYDLKMPGKVTNAINAVQHGDTLSWKLTAYRMALSDYCIEAQSRKTNTWAFILTALILIVAVGSFVWKSGKR